MTHDHDLVVGLAGMVAGGALVWIYQKVFASALTTVEKDATAVKTTLTAVETDMKKP